MYVQDEKASVCVNSNSNRIPSMCINLHLCECLFSGKSAQMRTWRCRCGIVVVCILKVKRKNTERSHCEIDVLIFLRRSRALSRFVFCLCNLCVFVQFACLDTPFPGPQHCHQAVLRETGDARRWHFRPPSDPLPRYFRPRSDPLPTPFRPQ